MHLSSQAEGVSTSQITNFSDKTAKSDRKPNVAADDNTLVELHEWLATTRETLQRVRVWALADNKSGRDSMRVAQNQLRACALSLRKIIDGIRFSTLDENVKRHDLIKTLQFLAQQIDLAAVDTGKLIQKYNKPAISSLRYRVQQRLNTVTEILQRVEESLSS